MAVYILAQMKEYVRANLDYAQTYKIVIEQEAGTVKHACMDMLALVP